jgi:hypothetical protein
MPNNKTYTVAGISFYRGAWRLRTSNNLAERQKTLMAMGDTDINLIELPRPMRKTEIVQYLTGHIDFDTEAEQTLLAQLRSKWGLDKNKVTATAAQTQVAVAANTQPVNTQTPCITNPNWEPDF